MKDKLRANEEIIDSKTQSQIKLAQKTKSILSSKNLKNCNKKNYISNKIIQGTLAIKR